MEERPNGSLSSSKYFPAKCPDCASLFVQSIRAREKHPGPFISCLDDQTSLSKTRKNGADGPKQRRIAGIETWVCEPESSPQSIGIQTRGRRNHTRPSTYRPPPFDGHPDPPRPQTNPQAFSSAESPRTTKCDTYTHTNTHTPPQKNEKHIKMKQKDKEIGNGSRGDKKKKRKKKEERGLTKNAVPAIDDRHKNVHHNTHILLRLLRLLYRIGSRFENLAWRVGP